MKKIVKIILFALSISVLAATACVNNEPSSNTTKNETKSAIKVETPTQEAVREANNEKAIETTSAPINETIPEETKSEKEIWLSNQLKTLTLNQKIGQLFICAFRKDENNENILEINYQIEEAIKEYNIGGVIFFAENIDTLSQTSKLIEDIKAISAIPPFISIDEEGGRVSRLKGSKINNTAIPTAKAIGEANDTNNTLELAETLGKELYEIGFNMNFAPVADIFTNPENKVIGDRAFGSDPHIVMENVAAMVRGIQNQNVMSVIKHFPGHGDTKTDTHNGRTISENSPERLKSIELLPFAEGIKENCSGIMVSHITLPKIDENNPAVFSKKIVSGLIRNELKYTGLIITDSLSMGAIINYYTSAEAAVSAFNAGSDILLMPQNYKEAFAAIKNDVESGKIDISKIDESVSRILSAKYDYCYNCQTGRMASRRICAVQPL